jgi:hypothetical protein
MNSEKVAFLFAALVFGGALLVSVVAAIFFLLRQAVLFGIGG